MRPSLMKLLTPLLPVLLSVSSVLGAPRAIDSVHRRATVCNGHPELCDKSFGSVAFVGAHDSYAIGAGNSNFAVNQDQNITQQLNDGIRMLQMQAHNLNGVIQLCHTSCSLFNGGSLADYLGQVRDWLNANPNEVLSLLIVNIENLPVAMYDVVFKTVGLDGVAVVPSSSPLAATSWPTLGSMIDSGKRLVVFMDNGADPSVPYIIDEFTNIWESAFNVVDPAFNCSIDRHSQNVDPAQQMYLINHFLDRVVAGQPVPNIAALNTTNAATGPGSLGDQVNTCVTAQSRPPNFLLVDFYEFGAGSVFQVAAQINNVQYTPTTPIASPSPTDGSASSSGSALSTSRPLNGASHIFGSDPSYALVFSLMSALVAMLGPCLVLL